MIRRSLESGVPSKRLSTSAVISSSVVLRHVSVVCIVFLPSYSTENPSATIQAIPRRRSRRVLLLAFEHDVSFCATHRFASRLDTLRDRRSRATAARRHTRAAADWDTSFLSRASPL